MDSSDYQTESNVDGTAVPYNETINPVMRAMISSNQDHQRKSEENVSEDGESIVNILGQINNIVGSKLSLFFTLFWSAR